MSATLRFNVLDRNNSVVSVSNLPISYFVCVGLLTEVLFAETWFKM